MIQNTILIGTYGERGTALESTKEKNRTYIRLSAVSIALIVFVLICGVVSTLFGDQDVYAAPDHYAVKNYVLVEKGETLWGIATAHRSKGQDVGEYIHRLKQINGLKSSVLHEGQKLFLP